MRSSRFFAVLLIISSCGCASLSVRSGAYGHRTAIYPATVIDACTVAYVVSKPFIPDDPTGSVDAQEGLIYFFAPAAVVDFPLALAVDTLLLPYDLYQLRHRKPDTFREWKDVVEDKSPNDPFRDE